MQLEISHLSQHHTDTDADTQKRICALVCVQMIVDYLAEPVSIQQLISERDFLAGRVPTYGASHTALTILLRNHAVLAYQQEFKAHSDMQEGTVAEHESDFVDFGLAKMRQHLDRGLPTIVSVWKNFSEVGKDHMVLVVGYDDQGWLVHDPDVSEGYRQVSDQQFRSAWKQMAIFVERE